MKNIYIENVKQVRYYTDKHLAKFNFLISCEDLTEDEIDKLVIKIEKCTLRKDRFLLIDVCYIKKSAVLECSSLHGFGYDYIQDFEDLFKNYNLVER